MADVDQKEQLLDEIFNQYDIFKTGELAPEQLQAIHADMRLGTVSLPQIKESIKYVCVHDTCERSELFDVLQEIDRRYFLTENFRWEFSLLDTKQTDTISEEQARWFLETVHAPYFSSLQWKRFLKSRAVPGSGVTFPEIEVLLCNVPSRKEWLADLEQERQEQEEEERRLRELEKKVEDEKERKRKLREEEKRKREEGELKRKLELEKRRKEEEEERRQQQKEKEEAARRKKMLEEEEERGIKEAEERERKLREQKELEEKQRRQKEEEELRRLEQMELERRQDEERRKKQEIKEAVDYEKIVQEAMRKEKEADEEAERHHQRMKAAEDAHVKRDAEEAEDRALTKKREYHNKRIRYNLKLAIKRRDRDFLQKAMADFKKANLPDDDQDLPKAERILKEFKARDGLKKAMTDRQLKPLEQAISYVKQNGFELQLHKELIEANKVLLHLRRLERIRAEILELKQSTVAEIRSYQKPPPVVHVVMTATFLLLGHKEKEMKDWKNVQALVGKTGKEGLKRRCLQCEPLNISLEAAARVKQLLSEFELDEVRDVSAGAATFYLWSCTMIEESEAQREAKRIEEEERKRLQEEKRQRRAETLKNNPDASFSEDEEEAKETLQTPSVGKRKKQDGTAPRRSLSVPPSKKPSDKKRSKSVDERRVERTTTNVPKKTSKQTPAAKKSEQHPSDSDGNNVPGASPEKKEDKNLESKQDSSEPAVSTEDRSNVQDNHATGETAEKKGNT